MESLESKIDKMVIRLIRLICLIDVSHHPFSTLPYDFIIMNIIILTCVYILKVFIT